METPGSRAERTGRRTWLATARTRVAGMEGLADIANARVLVVGVRWM